MRTFQEHYIRKSLDLSGLWQFATDPKNVGEHEGWYNGFSAQENFVIPGMWNNESGYLSYEGIAWYKKKFYSDGGTLRFWFGGVMTQADIWFDGEKLGEHYGGFCEFSFIKRNVKRVGIHLFYAWIILLTKIPFRKNRWIGGITVVLPVKLS